MVYEILDLLPPEEAEILLKALNRPAVLHEFRRRQQIKYAKELLKEKGLPRDVVVSRLQHRYNISQTTAYQRITDAFSDGGHYCRKG